jgi:hypothetical protein
MALAERDGQRLMALKRLGELLRTQQDRLRDYLAIMDKEQDAIARGDAEVLLSYIEMEEHIVADIFNIQKVIDPLALLCGDLAAPGDGDDRGAGKKLTTDLTDHTDRDRTDKDHADTDRAETEAEVAGLRAAVEGLKNEATANAARNRDLLGRRMAEIQAEITGLRGNPYAARLSIYAENGAASMIDIQG